MGGVSTVRKARSLTCQCSAFGGRRPTILWAEQVASCCFKACQREGPPCSRPTMSSNFWANQASDERTLCKRGLQRLCHRCSGVESRQCRPARNGCEGPKRQGLHSYSHPLRAPSVVTSG